MNAQARSRTPGGWGRRLHCGAFQGELYGDSLRWIAAHGIEHVRRVGIVIRDRQWRTIEPESNSVVLRQARDNTMQLSGLTRVGNGYIDWRLAFRKSRRGMVVEAFMHVRGTVTTNRAGLVVLLPSNRYAGSRHRTRHCDGQQSRGRLASQVSAHQPVQDIATITLAPTFGPLIALAFEGDVFEMEDQRNWLDPTFKLYNRPLAAPFPYRLRDGERLVQRVTISLAAAGTCVRRSPSRAAAKPRTGRMPMLGVATAEGRVPRDPLIVEAVRALGPGFVHHRTGAGARGTRAAVSLATALNTVVRIEAVAPTRAFPNALAGALLADSQASIDSFAVYPLAHSTSRALQRQFPRAAICSGTFSDFVMLNRAPPPASADRVTFALCPTVHAVDDRSLIETLDALPDVFAQARRLAVGRPIDLGPCSLRRRLVPRTGRPAIGPASPDGIARDVDPRQPAMLAAAWLACVIAHAATHGVASLCGFEATGARGFIATPEHEPSVARGAQLTPAGAAFAALAASAGRALTVHAIAPMRAAAFTVDAPKPELWLVELAGCRRMLPTGGRKLGVTLALRPGSEGARWGVIPARNQSVGPYGIVRVRLDRATAATDVARLVRHWIQGAGTKPSTRRSHG